MITSLLSTIVLNTIYIVIFEILHNFIFVRVTCILPMELSSKIQGWKIHVTVRSLQNLYPSKVTTYMVVYNDMKNKYSKSFSEINIHHMLPWMKMLRKGNLPIL